MLYIVISFKVLTHAYKNECKLVGFWKEINKVVCVERGGACKCKKVIGKIDRGATLWPWDMCNVYSLFSITDKNHMTSIIVSFFISAHTLSNFQFLVTFNFFCSIILSSLWFCIKVNGLNTRPGTSYLIFSVFFIKFVVASCTFLPVWYEGFEAKWMSTPWPGHVTWIRPNKTSLIWVRRVR